jgi:hypothetical protein
VAAGGQAAVNSGAQRQDDGGSPEARRRHSKSSSRPRNLTKLTRKRSKGAHELTQGLVEAGELAEKEIRRAELRRVAALRLGMLPRREREQGMVGIWKRARGAFYRWRGEGVPKAVREASSLKAPLMSVGASVGGGFRR